MKESVAKTKWCPFSRPENGNRFSVAPYYDDQTKCIGTECMMWAPERYVEFKEIESTPDHVTGSLGLKDSDQGDCSLKPRLPTNE